MNAQSSGRLVILSGPSCAGKSPLDKALERFFPELHYRLQKLVLYNSRAPRPGETNMVDYHFMSDAQFDQGVADGAGPVPVEYEAHA